MCLTIHLVSAVYRKLYQITRQKIKSKTFWAETTPKASTGPDLQAVLSVYCGVTCSPHYVPGPLGYHSAAQD